MRILKNYLYYTIPQFFKDRFVRIEILKLIKSATSNISVAFSNITGSPSDNTALQAELDSKVDKTTTITGTGALTGGGDLSANQIIDASAATKASLALADTAVQPAALTSGLATKADQSTTYTKTETDALVAPKLTATPASLVADAATGTEVATINAVIAAMKAAGLMASA